MKPEQTRHKAERGQSLVEMTVGLVILLIIVMGILDLGRIYFTYITLQDAAAEAALYLAVDPCCKTADNCTSPNNAEYRAVYSADPGFAAAISSLGDDGFSAQVDNPMAVGTGISVSVSYPYQPLTPLISAIAPTIRLMATASNSVAVPAVSTCP
jgi:Flp pilus assembly protein TadG